MIGRVIGTDHPRHPVSPTPAPGPPSTPAATNTSAPGKEGPKGKGKMTYRSLPVYLYQIGITISSGITHPSVTWLRL